MGKQSMTRRGRPFVRGQPSANPGGRPAVEREIRELAQQYAPEAIAKLVTLSRHRSPRIALAAANALLDRGIGKPALSVTHEGEVQISRAAADFDLSRVPHDPAAAANAYRFMVSGELEVDPNVFRSSAAIALDTSVTPELDQDSAYTSSELALEGDELAPSDVDDL
jgi:hypothetical protein